MSSNIDIKPEIIDSVIKYKSKNKNFLYFILGEGLQYEYSPEGVKYSAPYEAMGKELWEALNNELYTIFCDHQNKAPKEWVQELISGDIRNLITGIITAIATTYSVGLGIAVPAAALIVKKGLVEYCKKNKINTPKESVQDILTLKRIQMESQEKRLKKIAEYVENELDKNDTN